jgi:hypothetical protein
MKMCIALEFGKKKLMGLRHVNEQAQECFL